MKHGKGFDLTDVNSDLSARKVLYSCMVARKMFVGLFLLLFACSQNKKGISYPKLPGYDLTNPFIIHLKTELDEISGIAYYPKDSSIFAINDELGVLYKIFVRKQIKVIKWKFASQGDYEDLVLHDSTFYALQSNGNIKSFTFLSKDSVEIEACQVPLSGNNDLKLSIMIIIISKFF
jgi:hypothetical protein